MGIAKRSPDQSPQTPPRVNDPPRSYVKLTAQRAGHLGRMVGLLVALPWAAWRQGRSQAFVSNQPLSDAEYARAVRDIEIAIIAYGIVALWGLLWFILLLCGWAPENLSVVTGIIVGITSCFLMTVRFWQRACLTSRTERTYLNWFLGR